MVDMKTIVAVLCLAVAIQAATVPLPAHIKPIIEEGGKQYELFEKFTKGIKLEQVDYNDAFTGLNIVPPTDGIDKADLQTFYWHDDLKFAVNRFITFIEGKSGDKKIVKDELTKALKSEAVEVALSECHYFRSKGLRESCFADQLLTYFALVLDNDDVESFFKEEAGQDEKLAIDEVKNWAKKLNKESKYDSDVAAEELGAHSGNEVSKEEFEYYVTQETINDDFRRCRKTKPNDDGNVDFLNDCLLDELLEYINDDLTDMDIAVLFRAVDIDGNGKIGLEDIKQLPGSPTDYVAQKIMKLLDLPIANQDDKLPIVDFAEFRTYMRSPTVLVQLERECTEKKVKQEEELECLFDLFVKLVTQDHDAIWLQTPDLEQVITFEILDKDDNGIIKEDELPFADMGAKKKFIQEIDTIDEGETVDLEEFNEYMDLPHMVYGTADCLLKKNNIGGRGACYPDEIGQIMTNIKDVTDEFLDKWFGTYDTDGDEIITEKDANEDEKKFGSKALEDLFLLELGQGDKSVTKFEFKWYVKQQELSEKYKDNFVETKPDVVKFHKDLKEWIELHMTEFDIQQFFKDLDSNHDHELGQSDFNKPGVWAKVKNIIKKIDSFGNDVDNTVNFREFWLWLNSDHSKGRAPKPIVKHIFEQECTTKLSGDNQQSDEIKCYVTLFKTQPEILVE